MFPTVHNRMIGHVCVSPTQLTGGFEGSCVGGNLRCYSSCHSRGVNTTQPRFPHLRSPICLRASSDVMVVVRNTVVGFSVFSSSSSRAKVIGYKV